MNKQINNKKIVDKKTLSNIASLIKPKSKNVKKKGKVQQIKQESKFVGNKSIKNTNKPQNRKKKKKNVKRLQNQTNTESKVNFNAALNNPKFKEVKKDLLHSKSEKAKKVIASTNSLREKLQNQLKSSHFRFLNEQLYTTEGKEAKIFFQENPESFEAYHDGFRQQVSKWPMNPLDKIIAAIKKMPKDHIVADFGCGEAKLARLVPHKVFSFDLVETVPGVIACDMAHCKLPAASIDVAVYCLSLMGTNLRDYLAEANRVLKIGGILKIAEVESRFDKVENFIQRLQSLGFKLTWKDLSHNLFYFLDFKKERDIKKKNKLPSLSLHPCLYKKR